MSIEQIAEECIDDEIEDVLPEAEKDISAITAGHLPAEILISLAPTETPVAKNKQRGRPNKHPFAGRINLLKSEIDLALSDENAFLEVMAQHHPLSQERIDVLIEDNQLTAVDSMTFVFKGKIPHVLKEMRDVISKYPNYPVEKRIHKERVVTDAKNKHYQEPQYTVGSDGKKVYERLDCFPDRIYGYVTVWFKD